MTLKEYINNEKKEHAYELYLLIIDDPKRYENISRSEIYNVAIAKYKENPEIILDLCTIEEIESLKSLIDEKEIYDNRGYLEYLVVINLKRNHLVLKDEKYYIPKDIINYVKMALNMYDAKEHSFKDVTDSVLLGLTRIYYCLEINEYTNMLAKYFINILPHDLKVYIAANPKIKNKISLIKYKKKEYIISLEYFQYKSVLELSKDYYKYPEYSLESVISIGKYKINLFNQDILMFLNFLECHLEPKYIDLIIKDIVVYAGFNLDDEDALNNITDGIEELKVEIKKVLDYLPIWICKGNSFNTLKENTILPDKNDPCFCGSGKKFKHCCRKYYK